MRDVDADAGHEMVFGDRYHDELRMAGGSACTAAHPIHELLPKADLGEAGVVGTAQCSLLGALPLPLGACAFCLAERCAHCPISRR